jgi:hypothetical protein
MKMAKSTSLWKMEFNLGLWRVVKSVFDVLCLRTREKNMTPWGGLSRQIRL